MSEQTGNSITQEDSLLLQCWASTGLIERLSCCNFFSSELYSKLSLSELQRWTLQNSGIGNPAMLQMMLYALLVIPKEVSDRNSEEYKHIQIIFNDTAIKIAEDGTTSTYNKEDNIRKIDYYRHIRNALSHSRCKYILCDGVPYVLFEDECGGKHCLIRMRCNNVGILLNELSKALESYFISEFNIRVIQGQPADDMQNDKRKETTNV